MTCPGFRDRDAALRDQMAAAQQKLHADMRRETDPRWHLLPVETVKPRSRVWMLAWGGFAIASLCLLTFSF